MRLRRRSTPADPLAGRSDDDLLRFSELAALGINPRQAVYLGREGVLEVRATAPGEAGGVTVASVRAFLASPAGKVPQEERITMHVPIRWEER